MKDIFQAISYNQDILANACRAKLCKTLGIAILSSLQAGLTDNTWLLILSSVSCVSSTELHPPSHSLSPTLVSTCPTRHTV